MSQDNDLYELIGKLNLDIYKNINEDLINDEIILTKKQCNHVDERRNGIIDTYKTYLLNIINSPDYIFEDSKKRKGTVNVVSKIEKGDKYAYVVLRLVVNGDNVDYKNSIITMWDINEKKLNQMLRNKKVLYTKKA